MIPPEGRDVQCSNCTTTWFQPGLGDAEQTEPAAPEPPSGYSDDTGGAAQAYPTDDGAESEPDTAYEADDNGDFGGDFGGDASAGSEVPMPPRRELDPDVRDVLREEAAREAALRQQETAALEHQDEMPMDAPEASGIDDRDEYRDAVNDLIAEAEDLGELEDAPRDRQATEYFSDDPASAAAIDPVEAGIAATAAAAAAGGAAAARRDLLPDIEEINATLRGSETRSPGASSGSDFATVEERPRRQRGTRIGFGLAVLIFAGLIAVYANAPRIAEAVPQTAPVLEVFVAQVDQLRAWVDEIAQGALTTPETDTPQADPEAPAPAVEQIEPAVPEPQTDGAQSTAGEDAGSDQ